jgi:hypothetical protein
VAAGRTELTPQHVRLEDSYLWWDLSRGSYFVECNEILDLAEDEIALIEPEDRLLRTGAWHVPLYVRGHVAPIELLLEVSVARLRVKENARFAHVRVFHVSGVKNTGHKPSRVPGVKAPQPKRARRKK